MADLTNIYFISDGERIKIGKSNEPVGRLLQLQTGNPKPLRLLYIINNVPDFMEAHTHSVSAYYSLNQGEWFHKEVVKHLQKNPWYKEHMKPYIPIRGTNYTSL